MFAAEKVQLLSTCKILD